jgi:hypothetical protein
LISALARNKNKPNLPFKILNNLERGKNVLERLPATVIQG